MTEDEPPRSVSAAAVSHQQLEQVLAVVISGVIDRRLAQDAGFTRCVSLTYIVDS
jgi:hypothetical protein